jgi:uncharacterized protein (TIGR02246 family)
VSGGRYAASGLAPDERASYAGYDVTESMQSPAIQGLRIRTQPIEKETRQMKKLIASVLSVAAAFAVPVWTASSQASSADSSAVDAIRQLGQDMGDAMIALDVDKIDRIFGDDWVSVGSSGNVSTKETLLRDIKTGKKKLTWFELKPIDVQVFGDVAIAQGNVAEKRIIDGKEIYMELVYADILKKRDGRWVVVNSMGAKVK